MPDAEQILPAQQKIFQEDETATPLFGYPVLLTPELAALDRAFDGYLAQEEEVEYATLQRIAFDSSAFGGAWERYRLLLTRATENSITASYGRSFPGNLLALPFGRHRQGLQGHDEAPAAARSGVGQEQRRRVPLPGLPSRPRPAVESHLRPGEPALDRHRGGRAADLPHPPHPDEGQRPDLHRGPHQPEPRRARRLLLRLPQARRPRLQGAPGAGPRVVLGAAAPRQGAAAALRACSAKSRARSPDSTSIAPAT